MNFLLKIVEGPNKGAEIALVSGVAVTLGKGDDCDIVLADPTLPSAPVSIEASDSGVTVDGEPLEPFAVKTSGATSFAIGPSDAPWGELKWPGRAESREAESQEPESRGAGGGSREPDAERREPDAEKPEESPEAGPPRRRRGGCCGCIVALVLLAFALAALAWFYRAAIKDFCKARGYDVPEFFAQSGGTEAAQPVETNMLAAVAARYGLSVEEGGGTPRLVGDLKTRAERLRATAEAYEVMPGVELDIVDDESFRTAADDALFTLTEGALKVVAATNRALSISGISRSPEALRRTLVALNADIPKLSGVDVAGVKFGIVPRQVAMGDGHEDVEAAESQVPRPKSKKAATPSFPVCGILTKPYPCLVMRDGSRMLEGAALGETGIIPREEAVNFLGHITSTLEGMERYSGHFYNWYDTLTLQAMEPRVISTVDSGNLCAAMLCARSALSGWGCETLSKRLEKLINAMDFSPFYDKKRELFLISYDPARGESAGGCYDLMASEAMLTSYLAVARGQAPLRHWRRLSRAQVQKDGYRGLASWTGTMFEYLMPALFLPLYRSSLLHESARFCVYVQKRRHLPGKPWGISESAFYALDPSLSYRYKAHGCPELALRRGMGDELVIAPYASFLALAVEPAAAVRNLRRIRDLGLWGRWGPMEALDFTPGRCLRPDGEPVPCWMAHHVGMSILAAVNALENGAVRRLFLASPEISACTLLLQEKLPDGGALIRREAQSVPERPGKAAHTLWSLTGGEADRTPRASLLSNGVYSLRLTNRGVSEAMLGELCVYRPEDCPVFELGGEALTDLASLRWTFGEERCRFDCETQSAAVSLERQCAAGELGESLLLTLRPKRDGTLPLALRFTPVLARVRDWEDHRAYWQLGLEAEERDGRLLLRRLPKNGLKELWLCLGSDLPLRFTADRAGGLGAAADPRVCCEGQLALRRGRETRAHFALCLAASRDAALAGTGRMLAEGRPAAGAMLRWAALRLGMNAAQIDRAMELVLPLRQNRLADARPRRALWRWGVSGELPILCCEAEARESEELLRAFCLLKSCGLEAELVFLSQEAGAYRRPGLARLEKLLASVGLEALLGARGGVFFLPAEAEEAVGSRAAYFVGRPAPAPLPMPRPIPAERTGPVPLWRFEKESFVFRIKGALPPRIWQHILSDGRLGAFAADFGPAGLWFQNAREMRLIPPPGSIRDTQGRERLCAVADGETVSLFADGKSPCEIRYAPGLAVWKKRVAGREIETAMFLNSAAPLRLLKIRGADGLPLVWDLEPFAGGPDAACLRIETRGNLAVLSNDEAFLPDTPTLLSASVPCRFESGFLPRALRVFCTAEPVTLLALGCATEEELARALRPGQAEEACAEAQALAQSFAGRLQAEEIPPVFAHMVNVWAPYQARVCRLLGRSSLYQSGGAVGFRDQLQDSVNLMLLSAAPARRQILECCRHQYREGDVQHWWHRHPDGDRGLRSRCSDDLLWLVWALCEYCAATGDLKLCAVREPWLASPPLREDERDRYETAAQTEERAPVLEHAYAALERCVRRGFGPHALPRIGSGDWNDGLDRVEGESVWLGWFLSCCAGRFAELLDGLGDRRAARLRTLGESVGRAAEATFDGRWYPRAWTADGRVLGSGESIDALAQSWAAFCPWADRAHAESALDCALARLVDRERRIVRLLDPPYTPENSPGYLSGYGKGFRENGGQYTHAAIWLALAALRLGRRSEGTELLRMLLPETHDIARYEAEPFVLPADVCAAEGREGLAGWTWYTGSAGWLYRVITEELLGLRSRTGSCTRSPGRWRTTGCCGAARTAASGRS